MMNSELNSGYKRHHNNKNVSVNLYKCKVGHYILLGLLSDNNQVSMPICYCLLGLSVRAFSILFEHAVPLS